MITVDCLVEEVGGDFRSIEDRLQALEMAVLIEKGGVPDSIRHVRNQVDLLRTKIEVSAYTAFINMTMSC